MFAKVAIQTSADPNVLVIPKERLFDWGSQSCGLAGQGRYKSITVELGRLDAEFAEIRSGLKAGERVVTRLNFSWIRVQQNLDFKRMNHRTINDTAMDHSGMDHSGMVHSGLDHSGMDHSGMDHSGMDHSTMDHSTVKDIQPPTMKRRPKMI